MIEPRVYYVLLWIYPPIGNEYRDARSIECGWLVERAYTAEDAILQATTRMAATRSGDRVFVRRIATDPPAGVKREHYGRTFPLNNKPGEWGFYQEFPENDPAFDPKTGLVANHKGGPRPQNG